MSLFDQETTTVGSPWGPLQEPVLQGVEGMQAAYNAGPWAGPYTAAVDPLQTQGIQTGAGVAGQFGEYGAGLAPGLNSAYGYFNDSLGGSQNPWLGENAGQYYSMAGQMADNPYMSGMVDAAMRDPYRMLTEQQMPGNNLNAAMLGQSGGSGKDVGNAILQRGFLDRGSDVGAALRGGAYSQGLGYANQAATGDFMNQGASAMQLAGLGGQGLGLMSQGATDTFNWGTQGQNLENQQLDAQMREFYEPWTLASNYGNYVNPLAGSLKRTDSTQDMLPMYLAQMAGGLGEVGGDIGGWAFDQFKDWYKNR